MTFHKSFILLIVNKRAHPLLKKLIWWHSGHMTCKLQKNQIFFRINLLVHNLVSTECTNKRRLLVFIVCYTCLLYIIPSCSCLMWTLTTSLLSFRICFQGHKPRWAYVGRRQGKGLCSCRNAEKSTGELTVVSLFAAKEARRGVL